MGELTQESVSAEDLYAVTGHIHGQLGGIVFGHGRLRIGEFDALIHAQRRFDIEVPRIFDLCGSFGHFVRGEGEPVSDPAIGALADALRQAMEGRRVLVVAAADLSHVGPAFGGQPLDFIGRAQLQAADCELIERMCEGDPEGFFAAVKRDGDRRNVCGLSSIYVTMRVLSPTQGEQVAYDRCPADQKGTSLVSICGVLFL